MSNEDRPSDNASTREIVDYLHRKDKLDKYVDPERVGFGGYREDAAERYRRERRERGD